MSGRGWGDHPQCCARTVFEGCRPHLEGTTPPPVAAGAAVAVCGRVSRSTVQGLGFQATQDPER